MIGSKDNYDKYIDRVFNNSNTIVWLPQFSMRNHETFVYDLTKDGNFMRVVSTINRATKTNNDFYLSLYIPQNITDESAKLVQSINCLFDKRVEILVLDIYDDGGPLVMRSAKFADIVVNDTAFNIIKNADWFIGEQNALVKKLISMKLPGLHVAYEAPLTATNEVTPQWVEKYTDVDIYISKNADAMVLYLYKALEYFISHKGIPPYSHNLYLNEDFVDFDVFINKDNISIDGIENVLNDNLIHTSKHIFYYPFRFLDENYGADRIIEYLKQFDDSVLIYTDPNDTRGEFGLTEKAEGIHTIKASSNKNDYYAMLSICDKYNITIPYLVDSENIVHVTPLEFNYFNCNTITAL